MTLIKLKCISSFGFTGKLKIGEQYTAIDTVRDYYVISDPKDPLNQRYLATVPVNRFEVKNIVSL